MTTRDVADDLAAQLLGRSLTKLGGLQIDHARRVARRAEGAGDRAVAAALLHDVLETTSVSAHDLEVLTEDAPLVDLVVVLSQREGEPDHRYLARCARHPEALLLKRLDLTDKLDAPDSTVPACEVESLRRKALDRLALLDRFALDGPPADRARSAS